MAKLHEIVAIINTGLTAVQFKASRFQKGSISAIAELIPNSSEETMPCTVDNAGECTYLAIDDTYPFRLYHRVESVESENLVDEDFGNRKVIKETANMIMVVMGDRNRLQLNQEDIIAGIEAGLILEITKSQMTTNGLLSCEIIPGQFNIDKVDVWTKEYQVKEITLKPNSIMFSLSYQIVTEINKSCFTLC